MADEVKLNDSELDEVAGGAGEWRKYAKGSFVKLQVTSSAESQSVSA